MGSVKENDDIVFARCFDTPEEADRYIEKVRGWFDEWRKKLGLEQEGREDPQPNELNIIEL